MAPDEPTTDYYPPPPPPSAAPPARRLARSRRDRKIAGVCGGLGEYFDLDPIIFRIGFVALTVAGGSGVLLYLAGMIFLPEEGRRRSIGESLPRRHGRPHWLPVALLVIGGLMLSGQMSDHRGGGFGFGFTLLAVGGFILWRRQQRETPWHDDDHHDIDAPRPPPDGMYPPRWTPPAPDVPWTAPGVPPWSPADDGLLDDTGAYTTARDPLLDEADQLPYSPPIWPPLDLPPAPRPRSMAPVLLSFLLLLGGVAAILSTTGVMHTTVGVFLAGALILTGVTLILSSWHGRSRGLIALGIVLTLALSVASVAREPLQGGIGQRDWAPTSVAQLERPYRLGMGEATLDLRHLSKLRRAEPVSAYLGIGQLKVIVPDNVNVIAKAEADVGQVKVFQRLQENGNSTTQRTPTIEGAPTIRLNLHVSIGQVEVTRVPAA